jgi:hypothetical protein
VQRIVDGIRAASSVIRQSKTILARSCEAGWGFVAIGNETAKADRLPSTAMDFEFSAYANFATLMLGCLRVFVHFFIHR